MPTQGYIPSAFFSDLVSIVSTMTTTGKYTKTQIITALDQAFNNANMGPAYVGCFEQVQTCLLNEIQATGDYSSVCPGPVAGCALIGSQNSTTLANTTAQTQTQAKALVAAGDVSLSNATSTLAVGTDAANAISTSTADISAASVTALPANATSTDSVMSDSTAEASSSSITSSDVTESSDPSTYTESSAPSSATATTEAPEVSSSADSSSSSETTFDAPISSSTPSSSDSETTRSTLPTTDGSGTSTNSTVPASTSSPETRFRLARRNGAFLRRGHGKIRLSH